MYCISLTYLGKYSVTRFLKVLGDKFSSKTNPNVGRYITFLGYIDKRNNSAKTAVVIFGQLLE